ncbi:TetR family transcriptional regulator [Larkinella arboricola]|uniref:TetR family transcriptional regulator n=1 Tax=Larkinella arboricola TaxID=643671 RepID=A0A327X9Z5_LARAB|nr:TetR/AcrR family transcriptional regulator [Larkinella arboricola]RAK02924.1 TetR family transcriptional regulator [Larkinella arboricola]
MKFTPRSETTRQFIIETTAGIFNRKGYAGTSMSDLTEATRLTKGSIYGNFENKEEVALAVFNFNAARRKNIIQNKLDRATSSKDKLLAFIQLFNSTQIQVFPEGGCPLLNAGTEADDTHEPLRQRVAEELLSTHKNLTTLILTGIANGEFRSDTDADLLASSLVALIQGGIFIARTTRDPAALDRVLETATYLIHQIEEKPST